MIVQIMPIENHVAIFRKNGRHTVTPVTALALHEDDFGRRTVRAMVFWGGAKVARFADEREDAGELVAVSPIRSLAKSMALESVAKKLDEDWERENAKKEP